MSAAKTRRGPYRILTQQEITEAFERRWEKEGHTSQPQADSDGKRRRGSAHSGNGAKRPRKHEHSAS